MFPLAESLGDLVLKVFEGGLTGFDAGLALSGQHDELGAPVTRVGLSYEVAHGLELVDELAHGLRAHVCAAGELGEPRAGRVDLREHGRVRGLLWESGADDPVDDAEAEQAVRLTSMATVLEAGALFCTVNGVSPTDRANRPTRPTVSPLPNRQQILLPGARRVNGRRSVAPVPRCPPDRCQPGERVTARSSGCGCGWSPPLVHAQPPRSSADS
jgi:hypothetical protein